MSEYHSVFPFDGRAREGAWRSLRVFARSCLSLIHISSTVNDVVLFTPRAPFDAAFTTMIFDEERQSGRPFTVFALMVLSVIRDERKVNFLSLIHI